MRFTISFEIPSLVFLFTIGYPLFANATKPPYLSTELTQFEQQRESQWDTKYVNTIGFIRQVIEVRSDYMRSVDPRNQHLLPTSEVLNPPKEFYKKYLDAAIKDNLTVLRAIAILGHYLKKYGVVFKIDGDLWEQTLAENKINLGLFIPANNMGLVFLIPATGRGSDTELLKMIIFYKKKFDHAFQKEVLNADLIIGYKVPKQEYCKNGNCYNGYQITSDFSFTETRMGFSQIEGIGGKKRGIAGLMQGVLSLIMEARAIESITVDPVTDIMTVQALIDTIVEDFEGTRKYALHYD